MSISPRFLDELRGRVSLSEVIGKRLKIVRSGGSEYKACCPFHSEKTPSFTFNDDKQFYHCFGCGAHGDIIGFVMQHDNLTFIESVELLASQAGMTVPKPSKEEMQKAARQKDLYSLLDEATSWYQQQLKQPAFRESLDYLKKRGVSEKAISLFRIGFAPQDSSPLAAFLKQKGYTDKQMIEAGLFRESTRGGAPYAFFRDRILFPVADRRGRVVAFGGRVLPEHIRPALYQGDSKPPKYINSSDTSLFHKGSMLYGEAQAREAANGGQAPIVVEGYLDAISCYENGFQGAVAPLGTALTEEQIFALWKMIPDAEKIPVLCFDGDNAGRRAAIRACERVLPHLKPDHSVRIAFLPEGQDPDSLMKEKGAEAFRAVLEEALPLYEFIWQNHIAGKDFATPEARAGLEKALQEETMNIADRSVQQYYQRSFRDKLFHFFRAQNKDRKSNASSWNGAGRNGYGSAGRGFGKARAAVNVPVISPSAKPHAGEFIRSQIVMSMVINHPLLLEEMEDALAHMRFGHERLDLLRQSVLNILHMFLSDDSEGTGGQSENGDTPALDTEYICNHLKSMGFQPELDILLSDQLYIHARFARPEADMNAVRSGWNDIRRFEEQKAVRHELEVATKKLGDDFSQDSENRVYALYDVNKDEGM